MTEFHESRVFLYIHVITATLHVIETNGKLNYLSQILNYPDI